MSGLLGSLPSLDEVRAEQKRRKAARIAAISPFDVESWYAEVLGAQLYEKQLELATAVRDNRRVSCCGANGLGKDFTSARIALWWMKAFTPAKVIIIGPSNRQVSEIVWQEVRTAHLNAQTDLGGHLYEVPMLKYDEQSFILGFATDKPYKIQGFHSPNLLVIVTEAHGMKQRDMDVVWRLNPKCVLFTGNPIVESGDFYDSQHSKAYLWKTININAFDSPNIKAGKVVIPGLVTQQDIDDTAARVGEDSPLYRMQILNEWCEGMGNLVVVPLSWARAAEAATFEPGSIEVVSCDPARYGSDSTVIYSRRGQVARKLWKVQGFDLMQTTGFLKGYHDEHKFAHIVVDGTGIGSGIIDRLREQDVGVIEFQGGAAASDSARFVNRIAEVWWRMRGGYARGLDVEEDAELRSQVSSRKYTIQSDKRIKLESKDEMRSAGRHSPDEADSLSMTYILDYQQGEHLSPASDVDYETAPSAELGFGDQYERTSLDFGRGSDLAPWHGSRWGKVRKGFRQ